MQNLLSLYKQNATHVNTFVTALGIVISVATGVSALMIGGTTLALILGAYGLNLFLDRTPISSRSSLRSLTELSNLATAVLSPAFQDDDDNTRVHCEAMLYSLERLPYRTLDNKGQVEVLRALAAVYMKLTVYFWTISNPEAASELVKRVRTVRDRISRGPHEGTTELLGFLAFAEAYDSFKRGEIPHAEQLLKICMRNGANQLVEARARDVAGTIAAQRLHFDEAKTNYTISIDLKRKLQDRLGLAITHGSLGRLHMAALEFPEAIEHFRQNASISEQINNSRGIYQSNNHIGMCLLNIQQPYEAMKSFEASETACAHASVAHSARLQNSGFAHMGLWLAHVYLDDSQTGQEHYLQAKDAFTTANFPLGGRLLHAYRTGIEAIEFGGTSLSSDVPSAITQIGDDFIAAGVWRLLQVFIPTDRTQQEFLQVVSDYFSQHEVDFYRVRFRECELKRTEIRILRQLPPPFDNLFSVGLKRSEVGDRSPFFVTCEVFLRWVYYVFISSQELRPELIFNSVGRMSMGLLLRKLIEEMERKRSPEGPLLQFVSQWINSKKRDLMRLVEIRNKWAHGTATSDQTEITSGVINDWSTDIITFLSQFSAISDSSEPAPVGLSAYMLFMKAGGNKLKLSPFLFFEKSTHGEVLVMSESNQEEVTYTNPGKGTFFTCPIEEVLTK